MTTHTNWSNLFQFQPAQYYEPKLEGEIQEIVTRCYKNEINLRVIGSGHSFSPLIQTLGALLSLRHFSGIEFVDLKNSRARVKAGTTLKTLGYSLQQAGLAQENLGDINAQSVAGALSTGTHGTGIQFGTISTQASQIRIVSGTGETLSCSENQNSDLFKAAQTSVGLLGLITHVELKLLPAYRLHVTTQLERLEDCIHEFEKRLQKNRHFEFFWFPFTPYALSKTTNVAHEEKNTSALHDLIFDVVLENLIFEALNRFARVFPKMSPKVNQVLCSLAKGAGKSEKINWSHKVFCTPRLTKFYEMEYNIPIEKLSSLLAEMEQAFSQHRFLTTFPVEVRAVKKDDIPLSPAYGRDSATVSIHCFQGMEYEAYFRHMETLFLKYEGRPHWGKLHYLSHKQLTSLYPRWNEFQTIRKQMDPNGIFLNSYLRSIFEPGS